ncbi:MAG: hypothetical protein O7C59_08185 [Rickettsia endosymbiont of Ixodes persulcatus]|nr:hypothetical protein [Rickettsia endosymbiont of Ixodes persulcatus]
MELLGAMLLHCVLVVMRGEKEQILAFNLNGGDDDVYYVMVVRIFGVDFFVKVFGTFWLVIIVKLVWWV